MKQLKVQTPTKVQSQIKQLKQALPLPDLMEAMDFARLFVLRVSTL